ncbi:MAG TPA: hypothetical protein PKL84_17100, partial [Candidatus Hydrogenedentes bacterium]|nr:hypothetical protein [Candidatus Hydrogenedentota bacterium]
SMGFAVVVAIEEPGVLALYAAWTVLAAACYRSHVSGFTARDWDRLRAIPGSDEQDPPAG